MPVYDFNELIKQAELDRLETDQEKILRLEAEIEALRKERDSRPPQRIIKDYRSLIKSRSAWAQILCKLPNEDVREYTTLLTLFLTELEATEGEITDEVRATATTLIVYLSYILRPRELQVLLEEHGHLTLIGDETICRYSH